ncbi:transcription initiation factor TFIID [Salix suchowensis]|nr:transcription initiation factor TFIID [Salix suchowensis]
MAEGEEDMPRDAKIVKSLLKSMGVEDYEPRVVHQFLELWYRYVVDVLTDAQVYSEHANKTAIDCDDVKLAIQSKVNFSFSQPPPREEQNPLPKSIAGPGIPLPPEQDTLISPNYQLAIPKKRTAQAIEETEEDEEIADPNQSQEQKTDPPQLTPQRVSFPLAKRPK